MKIPITLVEKLTRLGFKEYEAKVFLALTILGPSTASQIHEFSGVPRPRVYDVLKELEKKGFLEAQESSPRIFKVPSIEVVMNHIEKDLINTIYEVKSQIQKLKLETQRRKEIYTLTLYGQKSILIKVKDMITNAKNEISIGVFNIDFFKPFIVELKQAHDRNVKIKLLALRKNYKSLSLFEDFSEVHFVPNTPENLLGLFALKSDIIANKKRRPIGAVNVDGKEVIFILKELLSTEMDFVGVWIGLESIAVLQKYIMEAGI